MTITNYALIDHIGQVANISEIYKTAYAEASSFEKVFTMKKVCEAYSPYAKEITQKMRWYHRYNRTPQKVFIVCGSFDEKVAAIQQVWEDRGIETELIEEDNQPTYDFGLEISRYRRCAMIWGKALGWTFSAPLTRDVRENTPDPWQARPDSRKKSKDEVLLRDMPGMHISKISTKPETYLNAKHTIASEEECIQFFQHYRWLYENNLLAESLEPDYTICPTCGRPIRLGTAEEIACDYCDTVVTSDVIETYYDDSFKEDEEF